MTAAPRHLKQIEALDDKTRFKFWLAGRRGGKTYGLREAALEPIPRTPKNAGVLYVGPTNQQAKELMWNELHERIEDLGWRVKARISDQRFEFSRGRYIQILGAEKIRRVRGKKLVRVLLDEIAFYTTPMNDVWRAIRPCLSDVGGDGIAGTTPNGKGTDAYDFYLQCLNSPEWKYFYWRTLDNPYIDPAEIEAARRELDPKSFKQEYEAGWESFDGLAYYCFDENTHIKRCQEFDFSLPLGLSFDFNVNPTTLLIDQKENGKIRFKKEYSLKNSSTPTTVKSFCEDFKEHKQKVVLHVYGDASGAATKSNTGRSDYYYAEEVLREYGFQYQKRVRASNPAIIDRVAHANSWLMNARGDSRVEVDPSCKDLIRDLSSQPLEGRFPSDKNNLGHKADAFGYRIYWEHVAGNMKPQETIQL